MRMTEIIAQVSGPIQRVRRYTGFFASDKPSSITYDGPAELSLYRTTGGTKLWGESSLSRRAYLSSPKPVS